MGEKNSKMISNQFVEIVSMISPELLYSVLFMNIELCAVNSTKTKREDKYILQFTAGLLVLHLVLTWRPSPSFSSYWRPSLFI